MKCRNCHGPLSVASVACTSRQYEFVWLWWCQQPYHSRSSTCAYSCAKSPCCASERHTVSVHGDVDSTDYLLAFSPRTELSLKQMVVDLASYVSQLNERTNLQDLAYTLSRHHSRLTTHGYLVASQSSLQSNLDPSRLNIENVGVSTKHLLAFVYTGQRAQWAGMGCQLIHQSPVFRNSIRCLDSCLRTLGSDLAPP